MRAPIRSETDAFWVTLGAALAIAVSVVVGLLVTAWAGLVLLAVFAVIALGAYLYVGGRDRPAVLSEALSEGPQRDSRTGRRRILVIANTTLAGSELSEQINSSGEPVDVDVLSPVLASPLHYGVSDIDHELAEARTRLERSVAWARERGISARGHVGDPNPTTAIADELRRFGADEVIVVTHPHDEETWQERGELQRLRSELGVPVTHLVVDA